MVATLLLAASSGLLLSRTVNGQLPDDIQRELNQNLAEQARIQAIQAQQQQQQRLQQTRPGARSAAPSSASAGPQKHDPNNYSYQQVSPPIQYSYYQPFGDAAGAEQPQQQQQQQSQQQAKRRQSGQVQPQPINIDLNNLNFDLPQPQAQVSSASASAAPATSRYGQQQQYTPSFTGAGGLPVLKPIASSNPYDAATPVGTPPLAPQARVQQGPPLSEADFRDITGGENYGAPGGGTDFGLGDATSAASGSNQPQSRNAADSTDVQLREFGLPADQPAQHNNNNNNNRRLDSSMAGMNIPDFGGFNPIGVGAGQQQQQRQSQQRAAADNNDFADFGNLAAGSGNGDANSGGSPAGGSGGGAGEFDFAGQPSSRQSGGVDQAASTVNGGAPGSLQSLLGSGFPGLGGGNGNSGLDEFARANNNPQASNQRTDDGAMDVADLGEKADGFSGADLGGFEQPSPQSDRDFNYGAASNQQPKSVPYPDSNPQPVGTLWALTQPQSLSQTRYNALPDKGTYQDYPAYASGGNDFGAVSAVVDETPKARRAGPGRYGTPSAQALAPEVRQSLAGGGGQQYNYGREPASAWQQQQQQAGSDRSGEFDFNLE